MTGRNWDKERRNRTLRKNALASESARDLTGLKATWAGRCHVCGTHYPIGTTVNRHPHTGKWGHARCNANDPLDTHYRLKARRQRLRNQP